MENCVQTASNINNKPNHGVSPKTKAICQIGCAALGALSISRARGYITPEDAQNL